jgi:AcrR family transcriptional regulator
LPVAEEQLAAVFVARGFDGTRMEDLARAGGVPRATLYYHFDGKGAVLAWLMRSTAHELGDVVRDAAGGAGSARERLGAVVTAVLSMMGRRPDACRVLIGNLEHAGRLTDTADALAEAFHAPVAGLLSEGAADRSLRAVPDPARTASAIFGAVTITGLLALIADGELDEPAVGAAVSALVLDGLSAG